MTTTDLTRLRKYAEKKSISVSAAQVKFGDVVSTNTLQLFKLPPNALIVSAGVVVDTVANGAITVDFGFDGGTELGSALDVHTAIGYKQATQAVALTSGALTGTVTTLTGTTALTSGALTGNLTSGTVSGGNLVANLAMTGTVTTLTGTCTLTSGALTGTVTTLTGTATPAPRITTLTGKTVTAKFSAGPTAGDMTFIVEYIEYAKGNGDLTNYVA